jgi:hypothetical protein
MIVLPVIGAVLATVAHGPMTTRYSSREYRGGLSAFGREYWGLITVG